MSANRLSALPTPNQYANVTTPSLTAISVRAVAARSARRCTRGLDSCASRTRFTISARAVSSPVFVTRTRSTPSPLIVPPRTLSPEPFDTGFDSPVTRASFTELAPSSTTPSIGDLLAGSHEDDVAEGQEGRLDLLDRAIGLHAVRGRRAEHHD